MKIVKDEISLELIPIPMSLFSNDVKNLYIDFDIEKKYKFGNDRYIIKYKPRIKNFEIRYSHSGTYFDKEKEKVFNVSDYSFWSNNEPIAIIRIKYPYKYDYHLFHNRHQKSFVILK